MKPKHRRFSYVIKHDGMSAVKSELEKLDIFKKLGENIVSN